jgi:hypothetical protein
MAGEKGKRKKRNPIKHTDKAQSERFIKAAKSLGVDESGKDFERVFKVLMPRKPKGQK